MLRYLNFFRHASEKGSFVAEPWTKAQFLEKSASGLPLLGVGLRSKYGLVSVYAYAVYVEDAPEVHEEISAAAELSAAERLKEERLWSRIIESSARKEIVLEMQRTITGEDFKTAFQDSLGSRVSSKQGKKALEEFAGAFTGVSLDSGARLEFQVEKGAILRTMLDGRVLSVVDNIELATALMDVYLGKQPVSTQGKKKFAEDLHLYLARTKD